MDEKDFVSRLKNVMADHHDPQLQEACWSYREGKIGRRALLTDPSFAAAMRDDARRLRDELSAQGLTPNRMRAKLVQDLMAAGEYPPAPGEPDVVAPPTEHDEGDARRHAETGRAHKHNL